LSAVSKQINTLNINSGFEALPETYEFNEIGILNFTKSQHSQIEKFICDNSKFRFFSNYSTMDSIGVQRVQNISIIESKCHLHPWASEHIRINHYIGWANGNHMAKHINEVHGQKESFESSNITIVNNDFSHSFFVFKVEKKLEGLVSKISIDHSDYNDDSVFGHWTFSWYEHWNEYWYNSIKEQIMMTEEFMINKKNTFYVNT